MTTVKLEPNTCKKYNVTFKITTSLLLFSDVYVYNRQFKSMLHKKYDKWNKTCKWQFFVI